MNPSAPNPPAGRGGRAIRWSGFALSAALLVAALVSSVVYVGSERRLERDFAIAPRLSAPDPSLRDEGRHLAQSRGCADCHGDDFGGRIIADEMPFARLVGPALARASGDRESGRDLHARMHLALHHGVDSSSRPLLMMPSAEFSSLSRREIEALAAYFDSLAPIDRTLPDSRLGPLGRMLLMAGKLDGFLSAEVIDHAREPIDAPPPLGTIEYGRHAAQLCTGCHQADFGGGPMSHGGAGTPPAANLTPHRTGLAGWTEADFIEAIRAGRRPDGSRIDGRAMPLQAIGSASDSELQSIWIFLRSLPPVDRDVRSRRASPRH